MLYNNNVYSIFKSRRKNRNGKTTKLNYSNLEARKLLAGDLLTGSISLDAETSVLTILGTDEVDDEVFISTPNATEVNVSFNGDFNVFQRSEVSLIRFSGLGGDDVFNNGQSNVPVIANGGDGDDNLIGGSAVDRLVGNDGDDLLVGNGSADVLLGGAHHSWGSRQ